MRHAYLIIAHGDWAQLERLIGLLDHPQNDIFIHVDGKAKDCPAGRLKAAAKRSRVELCSEYKIYWGSFEMVEATLLLLKNARRTGYDYYHLLSGADMPMVSQETLHAFFEENAGKEFVHFATDESREKNGEIGRRTRLYHVMMHWNRRFRSHVVNRLLRNVDRCLIAAQLVLGVNRLKRFPGLEVRYGSSWFSITDALAKYVLDSEDFVREVFRWANSADELFLQTLVHRSEFRQRLYHPEYDSQCTANQRFVDWSRAKYGSPPTLRGDADFELVKNCGCLFARKFSVSVDAQIVDRVEQLARER